MNTARSTRVLTRQGRRPHLSVTIGLNTLAGLNDLPALLAGFGAIPACLGRAIATSAGTVTALLTDPTTGLTSHAGNLTYRPDQQLRDRIAALTPTCQFPSCRQPVWRCDIDHREPFNTTHPERGGHTDEQNTGPFCRRHHLLKHHTDWRIRLHPDNVTLHWTSPTGHRYSSTPRPALLPDLRVTTPGTAITEQLDLITTTSRTSSNGDTTGCDHHHSTTNGSNPPHGSTSNRNHGSTVEEHLTLLLLRHHLHQRPIEYTHQPNAWTDTATHHDNPDTTDDLDHHDDEVPPF